jgi:hypothetical protein
MARSFRHCGAYSDFAENIAAIVQAENVCLIHELGSLALSDRTQLRPPSHRSTKHKEFLH